MVEIPKQPIRGFFFVYLFSDIITPNEIGKKNDVKGNKNCTRNFCGKLRLPSERYGYINEGYIMPKFSSRSIPDDNADSTIETNTFEEDIELRKGGGGGGRGGGNFLLDLGFVFVSKALKVLVV